MEEVVWAVIGPSVYAIAGWVIALCIILSILFVLVDALRVDRYKIITQRAMSRLFNK